MAAILDHSPVAYRTRLDPGAMPSREASSPARPSHMGRRGATAEEVPLQGHSTRAGGASPIWSPSPAAATPPRVQALGSGVGFIDWSGAQRANRKGPTRSPFPRSSSETTSPAPAHAPAQPGPQRASSAEGTVHPQRTEARPHRLRRHSESSMEAFGAPAAPQGACASSGVLSPRGLMCSSPCSLSRAGGSGEWEGSVSGSASPQRSALKSATSQSANASPHRSPRQKQVQFSEIVGVRVYRQKRPTRLAKCASIDCN